jgi:hypothetical protein
MRLTHPDLGVEIDATDRQARRLIAQGWTPTDGPASEPDPPVDIDDPDDTAA